MNAARLVALVSLLALIPACTPHFLRPLDYDPPRNVRELYSLSSGNDLRYNGHRSLKDPDGSVTYVQSAGDLEARTRSLAPPSGRDEPTVELVTVVPFAVPSYFEAIHRTIEQAHPDVIVASVPAKGDETDPRRAPGASNVQDALYRIQREFIAVFPELVFSRDALVADARFIRPQLGPKDIEFLEKEGLLKFDEEEFKEALEQFKWAADHYGHDVMLHNFMDAFVETDTHGREPVRMTPGEPLPEPAFDLKATFESEVALARKLEDEEERRGALRKAFAVHRLSDATLEAMDLTAAAGARRVVLLCESRTAMAVSAKLLARGYTVERDRWLLAIPILSRGAPPKK